MRGFRLPPYAAAVSAILMASDAFALDTLGDGALAEAWAQDGITFRIRLADMDGSGPGTTLGLTAARTIWHDDNGIPSMTSPGAVLHGSGVAGDRLELSMAAGSEIVATLDSVGDVDVAGGNQPMLNLDIAVPAFTFKTGRAYVAASAGVNSPVTNISAAYAENMTINVGALNIRVQLGKEAQGHMAMISGSMAGGITASNFALNDVNSGGSISIAGIALDNNGAGTALDLSLAVDVGLTGLVAQVLQLGTVGGGVDMRLTGVKFGDASTAAIGAVDIIGLNLATLKLQISGHL